jgi:hypothetical protein
MLTYTDEQIRDEAERLGLIAEDEALPRHLRSQAVASLARSQAPEPELDPTAGAELSVYSQGPVLLDGQPFPLTVVASDPIEVTARHGGLTTVRLTVVVGACHLIPCAPTTPDA